MRFLRLFVAFILLFPFSVFASEVGGHSKNLIPRTIIALYDSSYENYTKIAETMTHRFAEMPLNHLGMVLEYHDVKDSLPDISAREDVKGVLTWFDSGERLNDPVSYIKWGIDVVKSGKKFVIIGDPGFFSNKKGEETPKVTINRFMNYLGLRDTGEWFSITYDVSFVQERNDIINFEREIKGFLKPYPRFVPVDSSVQSLLIARKAGDPETDSHLVTMSENGGYIAEGYASFVDIKSDRAIHQWFINPFKYFSQIFDISEQPKFDTTTYNGRRLYYSHIDGDGYNNITHIERYRKKRAFSSEVILKEIINAYPDMPVTVGIVAGDIDVDWAGYKKGQKLAKEILAKDNVEVASHTYSHPFFWQFFENYDYKKEEIFLDKYVHGSWEAVSIFDKMKRKLFSSKDSKSYVIHEDYEIPRAYANEKFDIHHEIVGSSEKIEKYAPEGKKVKLVQWSGDTSPFEGALRETREAGYFNINGGDSRFDTEYPSYSWVSPLGRRVGDEIQVYASNSNENTYTDLWQGRFHGFKYLINTFENTEMPIRVKPFNIYYHFYSGERESSLNALKENIDYVKSKKFMPVTTSHYASIVDSFYKANIFELGNNKYSVENRGTANTIRIDKASLLGVDFVESKGVIGQKHHQGSLYIALDKIYENPIVVLHDNENFSSEPDSKIPYLIESNWQIYDVKRNVGEVSFVAEGFGDGEIIWKLPERGAYVVELDNSDVKYEFTTDELSVLEVKLPIKALLPIRVKISKKGE